MRTQIQIGWPFDAHCHLRIGPMMRAVVPLVAQHCQMAVVEPNLQLPGVEEFGVRTAEQATIYRGLIKEAALAGGYPEFRALMTVLLTDDTDPADVEYWPEAGVVAGKRFPGGLYAHGGVNDDSKLGDVYQAMAEHGIVLSGHFERAGVYPQVAERSGIRDFRRLADRGDVRVIFEHASTAKALEAVQEYSHTAATITPHHLWMTADDVYNDEGEVANPHNWCRPPAKTIEDREALRAAATSGNPPFFFGSDFAPHLAFSKVSIPPPAGCANYPAGLAVVADVFAKREALHLLGDFTSGHAARFYGVTLSGAAIGVVKRKWIVDSIIPIGPHVGEMIIPWLAGAKLAWRVCTNT